MTPAAPPPHVAPDFHPLPFKYTLVICYSLLCLYAAKRLYTHIHQKNSKRSFTFGLLCLVLTWGALRSCFWLATTIGPRTVSEADSNAYFVALKVVFYWIPFALQFTSYSLFSLFLGKVVYREEWKSDRCKRTFLTGFTTSNAVLFIFVMVWATWSTLIAIRSPLLPVTPATHSNASGGGGGGPSPSPFPSPSPATPAPHNVGTAEFHGGGGIPWVPTHHANCEIQVLDAVLEAVMGASFAVLFLSFTLLTYKYITITTQQVSSRMLVFRPKHLGALCVSVEGVPGNAAERTRFLCINFYFILLACSTHFCRSSCPSSFYHVRR